MMLWVLNSVVDDCLSLRYKYMYVVVCNEYSSYILHVVVHLLSLIHI